MSELNKDLVIERINASYIRIYTDDLGIIESLHTFYQYEEPGFTKNRYSKWDGRVRLFNKNTGLLPYGCLQMLLQYAKEMGWSYELDDRFKEDITKVTLEELKTWSEELNIHSGGNPITPYDYQLEGLFYGVRFNRLVCLASTSAGKSLLAYLLSRYYEMLTEDDGLKILIIVPSQNLVSQMYNDFKDYSSHNGWNVDEHVHYIMQGRPKNASKPVYISTWQSIFEEDKEYFKQFGRIICDEVHTSKGASISNIMNNATNAYQRFGMTGTLQSDKVSPILITGLFGPIKRIVSTKELIDSGRATKTNITMLQLDYSEYESNIVKGQSYQCEIEWLIGHSYRNKVIESLALSLKGNTLILFDRVDKHLEKVYESLNQKDSTKKIFKITGDVDNKTRDAIKAATERNEDIVILGTYGCVSTGVSIKRLHNLVFAHPSKSIIRVLQSVGRLLRLHETKETANIYDIVDNMVVGEHKNYALKHALERYGYYKQEQHPMSVKKIPMKNHEEGIIEKLLKEEN